jgi:cytidylate kinase
MIITIDGPSGTGKSTVAKRVAEALQFNYFETGALFRAVAAVAIEQKIDDRNPILLEKLLAEFPLSVHILKDTIHVFAGAFDTTPHLRRLDVTDGSSRVSTYGFVRDHVAAVLHTFANEGNAVFEGRDMGTVIFPNAPLKIFLTATPEIRAERRYKEMRDKDPHFSVPLEQILADINERDRRDMTRKLSPLHPAADAHIIDTSHLSREEVVAVILDLYKKSP